MSDSARRLHVPAVGAARLVARDRRRRRARCGAQRPRDAAGRSAASTAPATCRRRCALRPRRRHRARSPADHARRPAAWHDTLRGRLHAAGRVRARGPAVAVHARGAGTAQRLRPWLVLVVVRRQDGVRLDPRPNGPLPVLEIDSPARAADELPDLAQSWAWAHAQIAGMPGDADASADARGVARRHLLAPDLPAPPGAGHRVSGLPRAGVRGRREGRARRCGRGRRRSGARAGVDERHRHAAAAGLPLVGVRDRAGRQLRDAGAPPQPRPLDPESASRRNLDISHAGSGLPAVPPETPARSSACRPRSARPAPTRCRRGLTRRGAIPAGAGAADGFGPR